MGLIPAAAVFIVSIFVIFRDPWWWASYSAKVSASDAAIKVGVGAMATVVSFTVPWATVQLVGWIVEGFKPPPPDDRGKVTISLIKVLGFVFVALGSVLAVSAIYEIWQPVHAAWATRRVETIGLMALGFLTLGIYSLSLDRPRR